MGKRMKEISIRQIKDYFKGISEDYEIYGNLDDRITGFSPFGTYKPGTVTWIKNMEKYREFSSTGKMADPVFIIIDKEVEKASNYANRLVCSNPKYAFALLLKEFFECKNDFGIGKGSIVSKDACLEDGISIGCNCLIEDGVTIGRGTKIYHNVVIREGTVIGRDCVVKSNTVIGEEGYGYSKCGGHIVHVPHFGHVVIEDGVEIGSNCSIDRGTMENTVIGEGSKIDNLCHIAHNVQIGKNVMIVAHSVICGSVCVKDNAYIAPGGMIKNQVEIGENCLVGMGSVVLDNTQGNKVYVGIPAKQLKDAKDVDL